MPSSLRLPLALVSMAAASLGCSAPVAGAGELADASGGMTEGVVLVERVAAADGATQTNVSAKFMRLGPSADPELAERAVGVRLDLPALGECVVAPTDGSDAALPASRSAEIELLDVGDVTIRAGASAMPLAARAFPDVGAFVSGVFYTSRDTASDLPAPASYVLEGTGSSAVERFSVTGDAPASPEDVRVGGAALGDGLALEEGTAAVVRWRASPGATADDVVLVTLVTSGAAGGSSVRCAFADRGVGTVPGAQVRAQVGTLAVHRIRQRSFGTPGIDAGELRFDLAVAGRVTVTPRAR